MKNLEKQRFGKLTVLELSKKIPYFYNGKLSHYKYYWLCKCDCGKQKIINATDLINGRIKSCGCLKNKDKITHGLSNTRLYEIWSGIKKRCYNSNCKNYNNYGNRGIKMCKEWKNDFMAFYNWAINNNYSDKLTLDRIDNNGNYEPSNCRWATKIQQANNTRKNKKVTFNNETHTISEWARIKNIKMNTLYMRIYRYKWSISKALSTF